MVENLTITAGMPMPKLYVIEEAAPNAFATGRSPELASIAFITGIIALLENKSSKVWLHTSSHTFKIAIRSIWYYRGHGRCIVY